jgi:hypothetical protein
VFGDILTFFRHHSVLMSWLGGASLLMLVGSLIGVPLIVVRLPEDYLHREHKLVRDLPPYLFLPFMVIKNTIGILFFLSGLAMLFLPGQGLLTMFIGLLLIDFPRKQILVRRVLGYQRVLRVINRLRMKFGRPVLGPPPVQSGKVKSSGGAS